MLTGSFDRTAKLWDAGSGKLLPSLQGHAKVVARKPRPRAPPRWLLHSVRDHPKAVAAVAFIPDD